MSSCSCDTGDARCDTCPEEPKPIVTVKTVDTFYNLKKNDEIDPIDLSTKIEIVTEEVVTGDGRFDRYMRAGKNQLNTQYDLGRIKGADYTNAYIAMQEGMMTQANQFVLGKYQADILGIKTGYEIAEMLAKGILERNLLSAKIVNTELEGLLIKKKIQESDLQMQLLVTQEIEARLSGAVERSLKTAQSDQSLAQKELINTQCEELILNGASKRALESQQALVAAQQIELYKAQAKGFADKDRNDSFKTIMQGWAVSVAEQENPNPPDAFTGPNINTTVGSVKTQVGIL